MPDGGLHRQPAARRQHYGMVEGLAPACQRVINEYATKSERLVNSTPKRNFSRHLVLETTAGEASLMV